MLKELFHIKPDAGEVAARQVLLLKTGAGHGGWALCNKEADQLYELAYYSFAAVDENPLEEMLAKTVLTEGSFYEVLVGYDHPQQAFIPSSLCNAEEAGSLLRRLQGVNGTSVIITEPVSGWELYSVFAVPLQQHEWITRNFPSAKYMHQYSIALKQGVAAENGRIAVDFREHDFTVLATRANKLLLARAYTYSTPADVLFYLLQLCRHFELSQQEVILSLSGLIDQQSALYHDLYQYFLHIDFRNAGWTTGDGGHPAHFFTSFNDLARCVS